MALCRQGETLRRQAQAAAVLTAVALLALPWQAPAQTPVSGFNSLGGANSKKPIDIESDRLEVDDKKHIAIFSGNVSATQGDFNLRAPRLEVTYDKAAEATSQDQTGAQASKTAKTTKPENTNADASADPLSSGQIKFVHATGGKVVVTSKVDEEEATGDDVMYDVKGQKITMTGKEVILTQKKSVVKGKQIEIDLATGRATVIPEHGRVRAILTQDDAKGAVNPLTGAKKKDTDSAADTPRPSPGSSWQTQNH
jgi:lipopolysaccharide export system protein LptA